jgi:PPOX class probable F420-dependent enzyme
MRRMPSTVMDDDVRRLLDGPNVAHIATLMQDGSPHVVPVWVTRDGDLVRLVKIGGSVGLRNVERDHRVAMSITERGNQYVSARLRGVAVAFDHGDTATEWLHRIARQYTGEDYPDPTIDIVLVTVQLEHATFNRITSFDDSIVP